MGSPDIANYPSLTAEEFEEACHHLDSRYRRATLGLKRAQWKLRLRTGLRGNDFHYGSSPGTSVEITKPIEPLNDDIDLDFEALSVSGAHHSVPHADKEMRDMEASDEAVIQKSPSAHQGGWVTYEILLHPTYEVPVLYFQLYGLPACEPRYDVETVFRRLVPDAYKQGLRSLNGIGGISIDVSILHAVKDG